MTREPEEFVDPALRSAIRRAQAGHTAPPELRRRVADRLAEAMREMDREAAAGGASTMTEGPADPTAPVIAGRIGAGRTVRRLAAAAVILLVFGLTAAYYMHVRHERAEQHELAEFVEDNEPLLRAMIASHDKPAMTIPNAVQLVSRTSPADARMEASRLVGRPVPLPDLGKDWLLTDAAVVPLQNTLAARFDFTRAGARDTISLFSFSGTLLKEQEPDGESYDVTVDGHAIAGYTAEKCVHCIVGDKSLPLDEASALRQHLQGQHAS